MERGNSYGQILRSSAIMGGAQAISYAGGLLRMKVAAVVLGPAGVGLIGLYTAVTSLIGTVTGLGLQGSVVRAIAEGQAKNDPLAVARTVRTMRRLVWATGLLGWLATISLALPLSQWMFVSTDHAGAIALLASVVLLAAVSNGQLGLLQGFRHIGDIARAQVAAAVLSTATSTGLFFWLREGGIVPAMIASAAITLVCSWWFARRVEVQSAPCNWSQALDAARPLVVLGSAMMWSGVLILSLDLYTRTLISRTLGVDEAGFYQAAWSLSGLFAGFVLSAMSADFYPRLTRVISDRAAAGRVVNEQTEVGVLLAMPGLLATVAFSEWLVWMLYSEKFAPAADVLVWMVLGVFGRVVSFPMAFIQLSLGAARWYMATEAAFVAVQATLATYFVMHHGVIGAAYSFAACYFLYTAGMLIVGRRLIGFSWSASVIRMMLASGVLLGLALSARWWLPDGPAYLIGALLAAVGSVWSLRGLVGRLGATNAMVQGFLSLPGARWLAGVGP